MPKKPNKRLTPRQLAVQSAAYAEAMKQFEPIADTLNAARADLATRLDGPLGDVSAVELATVLSSGHEALRRQEGKEAGKRGRRPLPADWRDQYAGMDSEHPNWNKKKLNSEAARKFGISESTLWRRLTKE
ncbi:MAG: helix-turn-helix domain-containing protein [Gammaproteobacteria bacterium]